jgi:hypothetical protein
MGTILVVHGTNPIIEAAVQHGPRRTFQRRIAPRRDLAEMRRLALHPHAFHDDWNYELQPQPGSAILAFMYI